MKKPNLKFMHLFSYIFVLGSFGLLDVWLRVSTRWINRYSIYAIEPNLFTLFWSIILAILVFLPTKRKVRRVIYAILYFLFLIYTFVQYGAYLVLGNFLWVSDFLNATEGADYASWVVGFISLKMIIQILVLITIGLIAIFIIPNRVSNHHKKDRVIHLVVIIICIVGIALTPQLYSNHAVDVGTFNEPALEYARFSNANYDLELAGIYQYCFKDLSNNLARSLVVDSGAILKIDEFFDKKNVSSNNELTGIFAGKNLIVLQLETIDDWMITEKDMPTTYRLMNEGIQFSQLYTPSYGSGYTFNTEFAFNTSLYPYSNGNVTYSLTKNSFAHSIANTFSNAGYTANSYHAGAETFYNRSEIHKALGYEKYHSYKDYPECTVPTGDDLFLVQCDELYWDVTRNAPFYSFVITFSAHLPYADDDTLSQYALTKYPEYDIENNREVNILRAKARLTDDMIAGLLKRLEEDGLLENTVIAAYGDHYAYGLSDTNLLQQLSEEAGSSILERTPAFIYCADWATPITVEKVVQITDLAPTIMNLFGFVSPASVMGQDIFDNAYSGYAIFPDNTWLTCTTYVKNGIVRWNNGMTEEEIAQMQQFVADVYLINDAILDTDYYKHQANSLALQ